MLTWLFWTCCPFCVLVASSQDGPVPHLHSAVPLTLKPWVAKRIENKAAKSHVAQKKVNDN